LFRGISSINMDDKGRIAIPTRYRDELQECCERQLIVTIAVNEKCIGEKGCLWLYPLPEWEKVEKDIIKLPTIDENATFLKRFLIGNATECEMDSQGRMLLPDKLRKFAMLDKKAMLVGQLNKFEIWSEDAWNNKEAEWMKGSQGADLSAVSTLSF